ncbi:hypothetical protein AbraIFM66951_003046 [Aspergillus brasiliensis]|uniref:Uncharacterized protein n=1 Tax=Aspergillus brasiliensis TaxID=319629 RepID=A0A9W5YNN2_9EURO|nr:hypothetical protein AbraCBS73388_006362 [Aspergillus brasiliensis]GKZ42898.1 hypothetical protein AbraIFM66951_003046 [Aspergillus brasiliensis]
MDSVIDSLEDKMNSTAERGVSTEASSTSLSTPNEQPPAPAYVSSSLVLREPDGQISVEQYAQAPGDMQEITNLVSQLQNETEEAEEGRIAAWRECLKARQERTNTQLEAMKSAHDFKVREERLWNENEELKAELAALKATNHSLLEQGKEDVPELRKRKLVETSPDRDDVNPQLRKRPSRSIRAPIRGVSDEGRVWRPTPMAYPIRAINRRMPDSPPEEPVLSEATWVPSPGKWEYCSRCACVHCNIKRRRHQTYPTIRRPMASRCDLFQGPRANTQTSYPDWEPPKGYEPRGDGEFGEPFPRLGRRAPAFRQKLGLNNHGPREEEPAPPDVMPTMSKEGENPESRLSAAYDDLLRRTLPMRPKRDRMPSDAKN